jgi:hypothetical protein
MGSVDYTDFLIAKLIVIAVGAFVWGVYCGVTGRPLWQEQPDQPSKEGD